MAFRPFHIVLGMYRGSGQVEEFNQLNAEGQSTISDRVTKGGSLSF
jgi:hypothetical protein